MPSRRSRLRRVEHIMGMPIVVDVRDDDVDASALDDAVRLVPLGRRDASAPTSADSEISRLEPRRARARRTRTRDVRAVLDRCEELRDETDGYFDVRASAATRRPVRARQGLVGRPGGGDPRDAAAARTTRSTPAATCACAAGALPEPRWRVGIQHPREREQVAAVVEATDLAIATSGAYARGEHVARPAHRPRRRRACSR